VEAVRPESQRMVYTIVDSSGQPIAATTAAPSLLASGYTITSELRKIGAPPAPISSSVASPTAPPGWTELVTRPGQMTPGGTTNLKGFGDDTFGPDDGSVF